MSDVVHCHSCTNDWLKDDWGLICPHCESEATEIIIVDGDLTVTEETHSIVDIPAFLEDVVERQRARFWIYSGYASDEEGRLGEEQTETRADSNSDTTTEGTSEEVVIAVMGVTGSGKSTFIRAMTGNDSVHVGHGLESDTSRVSSYRFTHQNTDFVLVDTPGFDDTNCSDERIMTHVLEWLESSFRSGTRLNGLIYLHRIIDPKMQGSALNNMRMFRKLCGPECFGNIVLATTFWDDLSDDLGAQREEELKSNDEFWGKMLKKGSEVVRLGKDRESGLKLLMGIAKKSKITLHSQREMVDENKSAQETAAAQSIHEEILKQREEFERKIEQQRVEHERELERRRIERQQELEIERIVAAEQERERVILAALQQEEDEYAWKAEHERQLQELQEAEEEAERERQRLATIEQRKEEISRAHRRDQERLRAERQKHYDSYTCQDIKTSSLFCDECYKTIKNESYYHCCFCDGDNYNRCISCGAICSVAEHPLMKRKFRSDNDCIVM